MDTEKLIPVIAQRVGKPERGVAATVKLLDGGATIPFISRYRKEATGGFDEVAVAAIAEELGYTSPQFFCRLFKKLTGLTPSEYRLPG